MKKLLSIFISTTLLSAALVGCASHEEIQKNKAIFSLDKMDIYKNHGNDSNNSEK